MNPYYTHSHLIILLYIPFATHYCIQHNLGMSTLAGLFSESIQYFNVVKLFLQLFLVPIGSMV